MSVSLDEIVPFGRSLSEYRLMFNLTDTDLEQKILDCGAGPASFNAELSVQGKSARSFVISVDPIYAFSGAQIQQRFEACVDNIIAQVAATPENWVWNFHRDPQDLKQHRIAAMERFVADFGPERYRNASLPELPFADNAFDLALCSHLLFLYSDLLSLDFHVQSVLELCRLAPEVRIFPLRTLASVASPYVEPVREAMATHGIHSEIVTVGYELQKGGNQMLRLWRSPTPSPSGTAR